MNAEEIRMYCISKPDVEESFPFDESTLVFKTNGRMFLLLSLDSAPIRFNVKCEPDKAIQLREQYAAITPGYHMSKVHWNTITDDGTLSRRLILEQIDHSYELISAAKKSGKKA